MKIGIIGINKISKFYAIVLSQYGHNVILYESPSPINNFAVESFILEENFYNEYIKDIIIFESIKTKKIDIEIIEKFFIKESIRVEQYIQIESFEYTADFNIEKIPNLEIVKLNSESINQIKMMEDILILDTPDPNILKQLDLIKLHNWSSIYIEIEKQELNFQITKNGKYSIFGINENDKMSVFINSKEKNKKEVLKLIQKKDKKYKIIDEQQILKYDNYAYKNIAIINTALVEYNYPYRDYSLLLQIIKNTDSKKIFANLDIYSDIKSQVI